MGLLICRLRNPRGSWARGKVFRDLRAEHAARQFRPKLPGPRPRSPRPETTKARRRERRPCERRLREPPPVASFRRPHYLEENAALSTTLIPRSGDSAGPSTAASSTAQRPIAPAPRLASGSNRSSGGRGGRTWPCPLRVPSAPWEGRRNPSPLVPGQTYQRSSPRSRSMGGRRTAEAVLDDRALHLPVLSVHVVHHQVLVQRGLFMHLDRPARLLSQAPPPLRRSGAQCHLIHCIMVPVLVVKQFLAQLPHL